MVVAMVDALFQHPRLAAIYDSLDPDRGDLDVYLDLVQEIGAHRVLDVGCGTGTFALLLAKHGIQVIAVDPASGSLEVAQAKPGADRVRWLYGDATSLPPVKVDLATMTGNVAQAIVDQSDWEGTLSGLFAALRPGGSLVFETRDPAYRGWEEWNRAASYSTTEIQGVGKVENWVEVTDIDGPLVTFRATYVFASDGQVLTSDSTLRFRERDEIEAALAAHGFTVDEVRDAPDRPRREFVFVARRIEDQAVGYVDNMTGERDLRTLLADMEPELKTGRYVFTTTTQVPDDAAPVALVREPEGVTLVIDQDQADGFGLSYEYVAAMITLRVHSSLEAVGLTAAVSQRLATAGISCNVVAGYFHDHLFVPVGMGAQVVDMLRDLARSHK